MHRAFVEKSFIDSFINDESTFLPAEAEKRFFSVLRIKPQEEVGVFDGAGRQISGILERGPKGARFSCAKFLQMEAPSPTITLFQSAIEETKMAETIKRGAEFGIDHVVIFPSKNSEKYSFDKLQNRSDRLLRLSIDACRQSGRLFVPQIEFVKNIQEIKVPSNSLAIFGSLNQASLLSEVLKSQLQVSQIYILIGPEGGLSIDEEQKLSQKGFLPVRFSPHVLRTELAHLAALSIINAWLKRA